MEDLTPMQNVSTNNNNRKTPGPFVSPEGRTYISEQAYKQAKKQSAAAKANKAKNQGQNIATQFENEFEGYAEVTLLGDSKLKEGFQHALQGRYTLSTTQTFPNEQYTVTLAVGFSFPLFQTLFSTLKEYIYQDHALTLAMNRALGTTWEAKLAQALINELSTVIQFIETAVQKMIPIESYASYIPERLSIGSARLLQVMMRRNKVINIGQFMGSIFEYPLVLISSNDVLAYVRTPEGKACGLDEAKLPKWMGGIQYDRDTQLVFSTLSELTRGLFVYKVMDLNAMANDKYPWFNAVVDASGTSIIDANYNIPRVDIAMNQLYNCRVGGDLTPSGVPIYKKYNGMTPNPREFRNYYLFIWTGIIKGHFGYAYEGQYFGAPSPTTPPSPGSEPASPLGPTSPGGKRWNPSNAFSPGSKLSKLPAVADRLLENGVDFMRSVVTPENVNLVTKILEANNIRANGKVDRIINGFGANIQIPGIGGVNINQSRITGIGNR